jgi:hypothetical protein
VPKQIGDKAVGDAFDQTLLIGLAGQIAERCDADNNARQQAGPSWQRLPRDRFR